MDISAQMLIFASVVDHGSISAAARNMGQTPSALSKQIALLENQVHYRLLNRTRTGVSPTQEGQDLYEKCKAMAEKFKEAEALILSLDATPRGKLKVVSSVAFGKSQLLPMLPRFLEEYPEIQVSLDLTDRDIDIASAGVDVAIGFAEQWRDPNMIVRRIMPSRRVLCASPAYLKRCGTPTSFAALTDHNCLRISGNRERNCWNTGEAFGGKGLFEAKGNFEGNSTDVIFRAALAGIGIARLPCYMTDPKFALGELIHVLPTYSLPNTDIAATFANTRNLAPKTRAFIDFIVGHFRKSHSAHVESMSELDPASQ